MRKKVLFSELSYSGRSGSVSSERVINMYSEAGKSSNLFISDKYGVQDPIENTITYYGFPGIQFLRTVGTGVIRGQIEHSGKLYVVSGTGVYSITTGGTVTLEGSIDTSIGRVSMASNGSFGNQVAIVDGVTAKIWIYNSVTDVFTAVVLPVGTFSTTNIIPSHVVYIDGYFIINEVGFGQFYISDVFDGLIWSVLASANAERDPDNVVGIAATHKELYLIGQYTTEPWYNSGAEFPFDPIPNIFIEYGALANRSITTVDGKLLFLAQTREGSRQVILVENGKEEVISTHPIEFQLGTYTSPQDAYGFSLKVNKHVFYILSFPTDRKTWVYNLTEKRWLELESFYPLDAINGEWRGAFATNFNNQIVVSSGVDSRQYMLKDNEYKDDSIAFKRTIVSKVFESDRDPIFFNKIDIYLEHGKGLPPTQQGDNPVITLDWSDDGGRTWSNVRIDYAGKIGEYTRVVRFNALGSSNNRIFRISMADPIKWVIVGIYVDIEKGKE